MRPRPAPARAAAPAGPLSVTRRTLAVHASITAALALGLVAIWTATTPGDYFWPAWPLMALALLLAGHALVVLRRPGVPRNRRGLEIHAGLAGLVNLFLIGVWLMSTPGDYFWPVWTIVGLGAPVAVHAGLILLGATEREEMAERIDVLTTTRSGAVDAQAAELRRIERDLHDGAQARLVALAMDLGMAREKLGADPGAAEALVAEAHEEAKRALVELRDLARGIHPAVLTDRGLEAALSSLTGTSGLPVDLEVAIDRRPPPAIEAAAYFIVAESLANAAKHSGASRMRVRLERAGDLLRVEVADDGRGGADPAGEGLVGLRRRVEALDGRLSVGDGPDGGTDRARGAAVRVVIAEDLALLRDGIVRLLRDNGFEVVAAVEDGDALVRGRRGAPAGHRGGGRPPAAHLPGRGPARGPRGAPARARHRRPGGLAVRRADLRARAAWPTGAARSATCSRTASPIRRDFVEAVRRVASGGTAMDQEVVLQLVARRSRGGRLDELTPREREVLTLMAEGRSNAAIADALVVTEGAVEKHISNIFGKLGLAPSDEDHRRVLAVLAYLRAG